MTMLASQITSLTVVYSIVYSGVNQRKHQSSASLAFVREIHWRPVNFPHKWPVTRIMFPFDGRHHELWKCLTEKPAVATAKSLATLVLNTVYPKKYAHGFVVLCFVVVTQSFIMNSHEVFIHIHQGCSAGTGAIVRLPQCQWSKPDGYGKISQCITTTKHSKAKTVCIFFGIYCSYIFIWNEDIQNCFSARCRQQLYGTYCTFFPLQILIIWHCFSVLGENTIFTILDSTPKRDACFSFLFVLGNGLDICEPQNRIHVFRYMVKFSKYDDFKKQIFGG